MMRILIGSSISGKVGKGVWVATCFWLRWTRSATVMGVMTALVGFFCDVAYGELLGASWFEDVFGGL